MKRGVIYALAACMIWGLVFVVPGFMKGYSAVEVALGRYAVYGSLSLIIFMKLRLGGFCKYPKKIWWRAIRYSFILTVGYYACVVLALRHASPAICALILGVSPIAIAFYGNWREKEVSSKSLVVPALLTLAGLIFINVPHLQDAETPPTYIWGLICALLALAGWSWYVVVHSNFMKNNPHVQSSDWATLMGVSSLIWVGVFALFFGLFFPEHFCFEKCTTWSPNFMWFAGGSLILGAVCAWMGMYLWNKASPLLPVSMAGQLTIFETIFGVIYFYLIEKKIPPLMECIGVVLFLCAITFGLKWFSNERDLIKRKY